MKYITIVIQGGSFILTFPHTMISPLEPFEYYKGLQSLQLGLKEWGILFCHRGAKAISNGCKTTCQC